LTATALDADRGARQGNAGNRAVAGELVLAAGFRAVYLVLSLLLRFVVFVKREGPHLTQGPVILAPNHCSFMDPVVLQMSAWRQISYMMTEVFYNPRGVRWLFRFFRTIPVKEGALNRGALAAAEEALRRGWVVCVFPEGGISRDGALQRFHPGVAALALSTGAPVVPVSIAGTFEAYPRHRRLPRLFRPVKIRYGAPMRPQESQGDDASRKDLLRSFTEQIRSQVAALRG
jgi:1-acyl-sn-glycerol-3-phosphate acyltransferase